MYFDKLIWSSVSPLRKDSTYISLEYVINDLGIFCKGEQRTKDVGFAMSRIGSPLGLTAVENTDYAAKSLGRVVILWSRITDVQNDAEKGCVIVFGNARDKIVIHCEPSVREDLLSRIASMREFCASSPDSDEKAAAWLAWASDSSISNLFAPLDTLIEEERVQIDSRTYTDTQLSAVAMPAAEVPSKEAAEPTAEAAAETEVTKAESASEPVPAPAVPPSVCPACGAPTKPNAKFCTQCGIKL